MLTVLRDASRARAAEELFRSIEWQGDAPKLHVLDEATWHSLQKLTEAGLITFNTRATRHLGGDAPAPVAPQLTPEQMQRIADLRAFAAKKEKVAQLLTEEGLEDEAAPHREAAAKARTEAERIENFNA